MPEKRMAKTSHIGRPLRRAGQHLDEQVLELIVGRGLLFSGIIGLSVSFALTEWARVILPLRPSPIPATVLALVGCTAGVIGLRRTAARGRDLALGSRAEKVVADALEQVRIMGYAVFHDIPGDGFNVDHVLVGPGGVFVIETKGRSKRGNAVVTYRHDEVLVDGRRPDRDPVAQVRALRDWLAGVIKEACGLTPPMRAVVLFPGWYIEGSSSGREVWVLNEKVLSRFIEKEDALLPEGDAERIASALALRSRSSTDGN